MLLLVSCVGLALTPTSAYWLLVVLRFVQAAGSASTVALCEQFKTNYIRNSPNRALLKFQHLASGVIADIIPSSERGGFVGIINVGPMVRR